jgi:hypothetical protein
MQKSNILKERYLFLLLLLAPIKPFLVHIYILWNLGGTFSESVDVLRSLFHFVYAWHPRLLADLKAGILGYCRRALFEYFRLLHYSPVKRCRKSKQAPVSLILQQG